MPDAPNGAVPFRPMLKRLALTTLAINIVTILLGALVRATGSGAGCGASWPTCEGELIPTSLSGATAIEFTHRAVSGIALVVTLGLVIVVWRRHATNRQLKAAAGWAGAAILSEAAIGAAIVLFEWVEADDSVARIVAVPLHLVNTLVLLAALTLILWHGTGRGLTKARGHSLSRMVVLGLVGMVLIAATGGIAALADTLFPSESLAQGLREDFSSSAEFLTRLRVLHPVVAIAVGVVVAWVARTSAPNARAGRWVVGLVAAQFALGIVNVLLLTPVWMQLVHLAAADALWIAWIWWSAEVGEVRSPVPQPAN